MRELKERSSLAEEIACANCQKQGKARPTGQVLRSRVGGPRVQGRQRGALGGDQRQEVGEGTKRYGP